MTLKDNRKELFSAPSVGELLIPLKKRLFEGQNPFQKRWVTTPSQAIRFWLEEELIGDPAIGISMGVHFGSIKEAIFQVLRESNQPLSKKHYPSPLEMTLAIHEELEAFQEKLGLTSRQRELLARTLSTHFQELCLYGKEVVQEWKERRERTWEEALFLRLFEQHPTWAPLYEILDEAAERFRMGALPIELHLFGVHFISEKELKLLDKFSEFIDVNLYLVRPTPHFMGDLLSKNQLRKVRGEWTQITEEERALLEESYYAQNSLLAHCSPLSKKMDRFLEDEEILFIEREERGETLLQQLQKSLYENEPTCEFIKDSSIEVCLAASKRREVEVVYEKICKLLQEGEVQPHEIVVVAPDIHAYSSRIKTIFGKKFPYEIFDRKERKEEESERALTDLLQLAGGRFRKEEFAALLENPALLRTQEISEDEAALMKEILDSMEVTWGIDAEHRKEKLHEAVDEKGTWEREWRVLFESLVLEGREKRLSLTASDTLGRMRALFDLLVKELCPLVDELKAPYATWIEKLRSLYQNFLSAADEVQVLKTLEFFQRVDPRLQEKEISWRLFKEDFLKALSDSSSQRGNLQLGAMRIFSLRGGRIPPAKALFVLGMSDDQFPSRKQKSVLDLLSTHPKSDARPSTLEEDRELFLGTLFSATKQLVFTLSAKEEMSLSPLLLDLMRSVDLELQIYPNETEEPPLSIEESLNTRPPLEKEIGVKVYQLSQLFKNPLRLYIEERLKMRMQGKEKRDDFTFTGLDRYLLKKDQFENLEEKLPLGVFKSLVQKQLEGDRKKIAPYFERELYTIELKEEVEECWMAGERLIEHPALHFNVGDIEIQLTGRLEYLTDQGLLLFSKSTAEKRLEAWPKVLLLNLLQLPEEWKVRGDSRVEFTEGDSFPLMVANAKEQFQKLLELYVLSLQNPSPFNSKRFIDWKKKGVHPLDSWMKNQTIDEWSYWFFSKNRIDTSDLQMWENDFENALALNEPLLEKVIT